MTVRALVEVSFLVPELFLGSSRVGIKLALEDIRGRFPFFLLCLVISMVCQYTSGQNSRGWNSSLAYRYKNVGPTLPRP